MDYKKCLELRETALSSGDRRIAETYSFSNLFLNFLDRHYCLGLCFQDLNKLGEALEHYSKAMKIMEQNLAEADNEEKAKELQGILEDLKEKVTNRGLNLKLQRSPKYKQTIHIW